MLSTNFDYCLQTKEKTKKQNKTKKTFSCDKYFLFSCFRLFGILVDLMIASVFVLESRKVLDVRNREPQTWWTGADPGFVLLCKWRSRFSFLWNVQQAKKFLRGVFIQSKNLCIFPSGLWSSKFPVISPLKLLFWGMLFEGDCRSVKVFRVEFLTLKHWIWEHLEKFFWKKLVCLSFW